MSKMRFYGLGSSPRSACTVVSWAHVTIMLDCGVEPSCFLPFLPRLMLQQQSPAAAAPSAAKRSRSASSAAAAATSDAVDAAQRVSVSVLQKKGSLWCAASRARVHAPCFDVVDVSCIDAVLISNPLHMMALPYLTERTDFRGQVFATEPVIHFGLQMLLALHSDAHSSGMPERAEEWQREEWLSQLPPVARDLFKNALCWHSLCTEEEIRASVKRIQPMSCGESRSLLSAVNIMPTSSGFGIGSANWVIQDETHKLVYLSDSSSAELNRHPQPLVVDPLRHPDVVLMNHVSPIHLSPSSYDANLMHLFTEVQTTIRHGGCVLLPCHMYGVIFDVMDRLFHFLNSANLGRIPVYVVAPMAKSSLEYANILCAWLSSAKQDKVFAASHPFQHAIALERGTCIAVSSLRHLKALPEPCIVFASHPSLRFGDAVPILQSWRGNPKHLVALIDPDYDAAQVLAPFSGMSMRSISIPIDPRLPYATINAICHDIGAAAYVIPPSVADEHSPKAASSDHYLAPHAPITRLPSLGTAKLLLNRPAFHSGVITEALAKSVHQTSVGGATVVPIHASQCVFRDNKVTLYPPDHTDITMTHGSGNNGAIPLWGTFHPSTLLAALALHGMHNVSIHSSQSSDTPPSSASPSSSSPPSSDVMYTAVIESSDRKRRADVPDAVIRFSATTTHIEARDESTRVMLKDIIVKHCIR